MVDAKSMNMIIDFVLKYTIDTNLINSRYIRVIDDDT